MKSDCRLYARRDAVASRRPDQRGCSEGRSVARFGLIDRSNFGSTYFGVVGPKRARGNGSDSLGR